MIRKSAVVAAMLASSYLLPAAYAQDVSRSAKSIEDINVGQTANGTIVVLAKSEAGKPDYEHIKYAFVDPGCPGGAGLVDYYGPPIDPNDRNVQRFEQRMCTNLMFDSADGE
jgi:hypothetical protein